MPLFTLRLPPDRPSALSAAVAAGYPVRLQDGQPVIEAKDQAEAEAAQAWLDAYDPVPELKAALVLAVKEEASRRIQDFAGPGWRRENAQMRATRICWRAICRLMAAVDPSEPPEPALSPVEVRAVGELLGAEQAVIAIRSASDLIEADVLELVTEVELRAFDPAKSPRWPQITPQPRSARTA